MIKNHDNYIKFLYYSKQNLFIIVTKLQYDYNELENIK